jgi:hypothetical protein
MPQQKKKSLTQQMMEGGGLNPPHISPLPVGGGQPKSLTQSFMDGDNIDLTPPSQNKLEGYAKTVLSTISPIIDVLSIGQYASAKFFDAAAYEGKGIMQSFGLAAQEAIDPKERLSFSDVIKKNYKQFSEENPKATAIMGFLGDVALDPLTYLGVGLVKEGIQIGGNTLTKAGIKSLKLAEEVGGTTRFVERKIAENVKLVDVLKMADDYPAQKTYYLKELGFTDEVSRRAIQIDKVSEGRLGIDKASQIAEQELTREVKSNYYKGLVDDLNTGEIRERAEQRIMRIAEALPEFKSFESKGLRLQVGIPFVGYKDFPKYLPGSQKFFEIIGINRLGENIADLVGRIPGAKFPNAVFNKYAGSNEVPKEFVDNLRQLENIKDSLQESVIRDVVTVGKGISTERSKVIQDAMYKIDDASRILEDDLGRGLTQAEADNIKIDGLRQAKLTPQEHAFVASLYQGYAQMGELEMRTKLLRSSLANYTHREYEVIKDAASAADVMRPQSSTIGTNTFLNSSRSRDYITIAEARAAGKVPEMDALVVYAQRLLSHRDKMANAHFNEATRHAFGLDTSVYGKQLTREEYNQLPKFARNSIKMLGDAVYPGTMGDEAKSFLKFIDKATSLWKRGAYSIKPSSAPKQLISNTVLGSMEAGIKTFKSFDPRAALDAALMVTTRVVPEKATPKLIKDLAAKGFGGDAVFAERVANRNLRGWEELSNYAKGVKIKSVLGTEWTGEQVLKDMFDKGVIKGFDASGESLKIKVNHALRRNPTSIGSTAGELAKVWNWPTYAEDYSRAMLYINGLRMGYSPNESVKLVNKALFDYARGLSSIEKNVFKRLIPFYTFPRFAIPTVLKGIVKKPGQPITANKVVNLMEKFFNGEGLTPAEQEAIPGFILEQPRVYTGFDKEGKAGFSVFNGLTPFDAISLLVTRKDGSTDIPRSVEKSVLGAFTPFLKVPAELLIRNEKGNRGFNFFTGKTLEEAGKLKGIDPDSRLHTVLPQWVKDSIGWEVRKDPVDGKPKTYVNMYLGHTMSNVIPGLRAYINVGDDTKSPLERTMETILGISKIKVDFKAQQEFDLLKQRKELNDIKTRIKTAQRKGSHNEFTKAQSDYTNFIKAIDRKQSLPGQVRGTGMLSEESPEQGAIGGLREFK